MKKFHHSQSLRQTKRGFFSLLLLFAFANCTGELPISDLINNTITLKVMGTYESNNPYPLGITDANLAANLPKDDVITATSITGADPALTGTPTLVSFANAIKPSDVKYYIDIAEIRLARGQGKSSSQTISDYWSQFAIERQLMCSDYNSADGRSYANCRDQNGQGRLAEFFNGGFTYPAVDVPYGNFNHLGIYFRRFATSPSALFDGLGENQQNISTTFDNRTLFGFDVESVLQNPYGSTSTEPLMFPLQRKDLSLSIVHDNEPYVMEVRVFIHNLNMVHVLQLTGDAATPSSTFNSAAVFVGPADWNVDHAFKDATNRARMGGSMLMTARTYQPAKVGQISFTATSTSGRYFAVMPAGTAYTTPVAMLPHAATAATNTVINNLQPGSYDVYLMCDLRRCLTTSTAGTCDAFDATPDGFPETASLCTGGPYTVSTGTTTSVTTGNCTTTCP